MVTPEDVIRTQQQVEGLNDSIEAYQKSIGDISLQLRQDKVISDGTLEKVSALSKKVDELKPTVESAIEAVLNAEYSGDKVKDILVGVKAVNTAIAPVNPYAPLIDTGFNLLLAVLGIGTAGGVYVARKKAGESDTNASKYDAHKRAVEIFKLSHPELAKELYESIGVERSKSVG